ncbi:hypothetical protein NED98_07950 [Sphingomonas sp. MMSM20]|uniref:hypothetical protein n=1 Tax=Sphingomonas lycopersici TaxID=2951807 RepID=UPI0022383667|nr:hypothetical protein [Sphingomonas lycopersici]MCW6530176.1 hypothetical protein [Sphingomonas lycopersici]
MSRISPVLIAVLLAACSHPLPSAETKGHDNVEGAAKFEHLKAWDREGVLFRAVRDAGWSCQQITEEAAVARNHGNPVWRVRCEDKQYYLVEIAKDGTVALVSRAII